MSYVLSQFNQPMCPPTDFEDNRNTVYMTPIKEGFASRKQNDFDNGVTGWLQMDPFFDECVFLNQNFKPGVNYYLHAKIKRMMSTQKFHIYLVNYNSTDLEKKTQYLKTIIVQDGLETEWADLELIFSPLIAFDCIWFYLERTVEDYRVETRYPVFVYEELCVVNDIISQKIKDGGVGLLKIGVQSHPGLMMCINGEEIHVGRSGTYELRQGIITVEFFSAVFGASENPNGSNPIRHPVTGEIITLEELLQYLSGLSPVTSAGSTASMCIFGTSKVRALDAFTLDYMYRQKDAG